MSMYFEGYQKIDLDELRNGIGFDSIAHYVKVAEEGFQNQNYARAVDNLISAISKLEHYPQGNEMVFAKLYFNLALANHFYGDLIHANESFCNAAFHFEKAVGANTIEAANFNEFVADYQEENTPWEAFGVELITEKDILRRYMKVMSVKEALLDTCHPDRAAIYYKVGLSYYYDEQYQNAMEYLSKALEIREKLFDAEDVVIGETYRSLGLVYKAIKEYNKATEYFDKAYSIFVKNGDEKKAQDVMYSYNCMKRDMERE